MREWPLTDEEIDGLIVAAGDELSMYDIVAKYSSNIRSAYSAKFTHCAICPNPNHSGGAEKTPSFFFSEKNKGFKCFGCQISGNCFDLIGLMTNRPSNQIAQEYFRNNNITAGTITRVQTFPIIDLNFKLSMLIRDYLVEQKSNCNYEQEIKWADGIFTRLDERFKCLTDKDFEEARNFYQQILIELDRRKE